MKKGTKAAVFAAAVLGIAFSVKFDADAASKITRVKQTDAGDHSVALSWDASLECEHYVIEFSDDLMKWVRMEDTTGTEASVYKLSSGSSYYVRVTGYTDWSWIKDTGTVCANASDPIEVVTAPDVNSMSVSQTDAATSGFTVQFNGGSNSGANYYCVYLQGNDVPIGVSDKPEVVVDGKLDAGAGYWCYSYACRMSSAGFVARGTRSFDQFKTLTGKIGRSAFSISNGWHELNSYNFTIANTSSVDGYQLQFLNASGKTKKTFTQPGNTFRVSDLVQGTFYQYRVRTYIGCGVKKIYSPWSDCRYIGIPKKVTLDTKSSALKFSWSKVAGASKYEVYMSTSENSGYQKIKTAKAGSRTVSITKFKGKKIKKGKKYYIRIFSYAKVDGKSVKTEAAWSGYYRRY